MTSPALPELRRIVLDDPSLQDELLTTDPGVFGAALVDVGRRYGLEVDPVDVADELNAARRTWFERWL